MAILLDDRYVLLAERRVGWLERAYDGWDRVADRPVTAGWFAQFDPLPVLPATIRLRHPNLVALLDLRMEQEAGTWAVWEHFGDLGGEALSTIAMHPRAACWTLHEAVTALAYAREALGRPGGFRISDFSSEMIRLYADGRVAVTGFGRLDAETGPANELARLGIWGGEWLAHSHDEPGESDASVAADLVEALGRLQTADSQPQAGIPRILSGLRPHLTGGESELASWVGQAADGNSVDRLVELYSRFQKDPGEVHQVATQAHDSVEVEREAASLPRVRIAPGPREPEPEAAKTHKGLPVQARDHFPWILVGIALLLVVFGNLAFRPWSETIEDAQRHQVWLETVPPGATVYVDDRMRPGKTPLALDGLSVGWHRVRFEKPEFQPHVDSLLIYKQGVHRPFCFVFARPLRVESQPPGAIVYLNGKRSARPTPCVEEGWPATQGISLVMHLEQYGSLEDCALDPMYGTLEVKDPAAWQVTRSGDTLVVTGLFMSTVSFFASPPDCRIRVDDTLDADPTGVASYTLTYGTHRLRAEAVGFDALDTTIVISGRTDKLLPVVLSRPVRIFAYDPADRKQDLRVLIDRLEGPERSLLVRRFTPYSVRVPAVAHTVTLTKRDYLDTTVYIPPDVTALDVAMRPVAMADRRVLPPQRAGNAPAPGTPSVSPAPLPAPAPARTPARTPAPAVPGAPWITVSISVPGRTSLAGAEIWARPAGEAAEKWLGTTDEKGELRVQLPVGNYDLLGYLDIFSGIRKRVKVRADRNRPVTIDLQR